MVNSAATVSGRETIEWSEISLQNKHHYEQRVGVDISCLGHVIVCTHAAHSDRKTTLDTVQERVQVHVSGTTAKLQTPREARTLFC